MLRSPGPGTIVSKTGNLLWELAHGPTLSVFFGLLVKGGDPAARSRTATWLRLHPSR